MKELVKQVGKAVKNNPHLLIGWMLLVISGSPMMIAEVYLMSWLNAFNKEGDFPSKDTMYHFYEM